MRKNKGKLITEMINYLGNDTKRINHFMKVYAFAKAIGEAEEIAPDTLEILETAAILHDVGIKESERKYNSSAGGYQQIEGPPIAEKMLVKLGYDKNVIERVCWLISRHHTYDDIQGDDYQILVEADFIVNVFEDDMDKNAIKSVRDKIFKTACGRGYIEKMYL